MDIYRIKNSLQEGRTIFDLPLRVAFYARVSTEKDCQLHSFDNQLSFFAGYITAQEKWSLYRGYWDEGVSGCTAEKRQGFMAMIADGKAGRFDLIITKEISRFSRNTLDSIRYTQELLACGVGVFPFRQHQHLSARCRPAADHYGGDCPRRGTADFPKSALWPEKGH